MAKRLSKVIPNTTEGTMNPAHVLPAPVEIPSVFKTPVYHSYQPDVIRQGASLSRGGGVSGGGHGGGEVVRQGPPFKMPPPPPPTKAATRLRVPSGPLRGLLAPPPPAPRPAPTPSKQDTIRRLI